MCADTKPHTELWGKRILFFSPVVPQAPHCRLSLPHAVDYFHFGGFSLGTVDIAKTKNSWLSAQDRLLVDFISPLVFQLDL